MLTGRILACAITSAVLTFPAAAAGASTFDAASAFGARTGVTNLQMSPDGSSVVYVAPVKGRGSAAYTLNLAKGSVAHVALAVDGNPFGLRQCRWVANDRIVCIIYGVVPDPSLHLVGVSRIMAVNADGSNLKMLSTRNNTYSYGYNLFGGEIVDWLPDEDGAVLMARNYLPDDHIGSRLGSDKAGLAVDRIDTRTLSVRHVLQPIPNAFAYIADGRGTVRIAGLIDMSGGMLKGTSTYLYRTPGSQDWHKLSQYNGIDDSGFRPVAVDHDLNVAYGFKRTAGRLALYSVKLDGSLQEELVYSRPDVDVDEVIKIGRRNRVVGVSYATDKRYPNYLSPEIKSIAESLNKALAGQKALSIVDTSVDEKRMLIWAGSDSDPGVYYILDRATHELRTFLVVRDELEGVKLATMKPVSYPADDGTMIPGYLTLPPGKENAKGLPAIVLPHGGPAARDEWGFDWLSQFYAARGFAVLQPNFRGSSGYGDAWFMQNGFRSWPIAIGDVLAGGRWLVKEGIAEPTKLAVVGWSYGGYAALQSAVVDPSVFKAVVAIAPVTDLEALKAESYNWSNHWVLSDYIGSGPQVHEGSPAEHAEKIKVPALLFHGTSDRNVDYEESRRMAEKMAAVGGKCELVTFKDLDHDLEDSDARAQMLHKSEEFLRAALGMGSGASTAAATGQ